MTLGIIRHCAQLGEAFRTLRRLALLEPLLVGDRLLLHILDIQGSSDGFVVVQVGVFAAQNAVQERAQVPRLVDAGIEAEAADRVVDVRRISAKEHPALAKIPCHALVDRIEVEVEVIALLLRHVDAREACAHRGIRQRLLVLLVLARVEHRAPASLEIVARHLEQVGPLLGVGHVAAQAAAERRLEIELRGDHEEALRPGVALEVDAERLAHRAAAAVGADHVVGVVFCNIGFDLYPLVVLLEPDDPFSHAHFHVRHAPQARDRHVGELVLLGLHHVGETGLALQPVEVELGDQLPGRTVPELESARHQADAQVFLDQAELGQHLERRRLRGGSARAVVDPRLRLEQRDAVAGGGASGRAGESRHCADRARADDDDVSPLHFASRLY